MDHVATPTKTTQRRERRSAAHPNGSPKRAKEIAKAGPSKRPICKSVSERARLIGSSWIASKSRSR